jgi:hypothetical protein
MPSVPPRDPDSDSGWRTSAAVDSSILTGSREHHHDATADPKIPGPGPGPGGTATPVPAGRVAAAKTGGSSHPRFPAKSRIRGTGNQGPRVPPPEGALAASGWRNPGPRPRLKRWVSRSLPVPSGTCQCAAVGGEAAAFADRCSRRQAKLTSPMVVTYVEVRQLR